MAVTISPETYGEMNVNDLASAQNLLVVEGNGVVSKRNAARGSNPYGRNYYGTRTRGQQDRSTQNVCSLRLSSQNEERHPNGMITRRYCRVRFP